VLDPIAHIAGLLGPGGRCLFMPNGGNLGDALIAAATIQRFEKAGLPWSLIRGQRHSVTPQDVLVFGGGGSLVALYEGGVRCVASLLELGRPVVVLPQTCNGHHDFWTSVTGVTVFCRDAVSLASMQGFANLTALPADDMAVGLDMAADPFSTVQALRRAVAARGEHRTLRAFRGDKEAVGSPPPDTLDLAALAHPAMTSAASIQAHACAFLAAIAGYSTIHTDRLHVAIAGGLLEIPTRLGNDAHGKNRAVYDASLRHRFPTVEFTTQSSCLDSRRKVFGIGWAKTGTTTLGACLRRLGYDHQGQNLSLVDGIMRGDLAKTLRIAAAKESFEDWPWILLFRELDAAFPGSRFILTTRDPGRWLASYRAMLASEGEPTAEMARIRAFLFGMDVRSATDEELVGRFLRHRDEVLGHFQGRPHDLLVVDWERGDGWAEVSGFLGLPQPDEPFPHLNRRP
jgi:exopolysaccharide biosynthesis predicted pyruvyltransferase EpsI